MPIPPSKISLAKNGRYLAFVAALDSVTSEATDEDAAGDAVEVTAEV
ncbi:MAG: hypothetical protein K9L32_00085 [Chromatiaceae bacterium]|nr:hypothetical protein [Chromatiaceae bacterium]MCF8002604.1 hypothetical protein [Chromatiaceae bacterium]